MMSGQGGTCGNLGSCFHSLGHYEKAITIHKQNVVICAELGDLYSLMHVCR